MNTTTILSAAALAASVFLLMDGKARTWAVISTVTSGVMVALALGLMTLSILGLPLQLALGGVLCAAGVFLYMKVGDKLRVACATLIALVGALEVLRHLF